MDGIFTLPDWKEHRLLYPEGEDWKWRPQIEAAKALYEQWQEVFQLAVTFADILPETEEEGVRMGIEIKRMLYENAYTVAPKIYSAAGDTLYIIKMENAAIIRLHCRQLMEQVGAGVLFCGADKSHQLVIREAMEEFRRRFRHWVSFFEKDDCEDEWGLYV